MLHQLDLQVLIRLIMVGKQVVYAFEESRKRATIVFFFHQELFLRENLDEVDKTVAGLST